MQIHSLSATSFILPLINDVHSIVSTLKTLCLSLQKINGKPASLQFSLLHGERHLRNVWISCVPHLGIANQEDSDIFHSWALLDVVGKWNIYLDILILPFYLSEDSNRFFVVLFCFFVLLLFFFFFFVRSPLHRLHTYVTCLDISALLTGS